MGRVALRIISIDIGQRRSKTMNRHGILQEEGHSILTRLHPDFYYTRHTPRAPLLGGRLPES